MWVDVIWIYLVIGLVIQIFNMFVIPAFRKTIEAGRKQGSMHLVMIGSLIGIFVWPVTFLAVLFAIKFKRVRRCPDCRSQFVLGICPNCGPVEKRALLIQEQKEDRLRKLNAIEDPELRNAALRANAEVDADPLITQMVRKMMTEKNEPARKALLAEIHSAVSRVYSRHTQPIIDEAERRLAEHLKSGHGSVEKPSHE